MPEVDCLKCSKSTTSHPNGNHLCRSCKAEYREEQRKAAYAVVRALQADELVYPEVCELCGEQRKTIAHHWNGHTDVFNIWFICKWCSGKLHSYEFHLGQVTKAEAKCIIMLAQFSRLKEAR